MTAAGTQAEDAASTKEIAQHSPVKSLAFHLLPGSLVAAFCLAAAPLVMRAGFPAGLTLLVGFLFVGIPLELGYLIYQGKKRNGEFSLRGIVLYRKRMPVWQYILFFLLLFAIAFAVLFLTAPITEFLGSRVFWWLPKVFLPDGDSGHPGRTAILITLVLGFLIDGLANPVVEELYFRGYLLPRISYLGRLAPLMNAFLFSLQHFWQPYNYPLIFLIQVPLVYVVWWKRNIYISILTHCVGNMIGAGLSLVSFFGSS